MASQIIRHLLNHNECVEAILTAGPDLTPLITSEPGCGKSSMLKSCAIANGDEWRKVGDHFPADKYVYIYADCSCMDVGDLAMRIPDRDSNTLVSMVSGLFQMHDPRPKIIMLDEAFKSPKMMQIMFMRVILERCIGDYPLPEGSMVFATSNNITDNVGDGILAHGVNRIMFIDYRKPDADELNIHFTEIGVSAMTRAWLAMNRRAMYSYVSCDEEELKTNPFIFNPTKKPTPFVSPRSLHKADTVVVKKLGKIGEKVSEAMLAGIVGTAAASSMCSFFKMANDIHSIKMVCKDPDGTPLPEKDAALLLMMFNAIDEITTQNDLSAFMKYLKRKGSNMFTGLFFTMALSTKKVMKLARNNVEILDWAKQPGNYQLLI